MAVVQERRVAVMALRDKVGGAYVEEEPGKEREQEPEVLVGNPKQERGEDTQDRRGGVSSKPPHRARSVARVFNNHVDGVDAVGKVVCQHRRRHNNAHRGGDLKRQPDTNTV